MGPGLSLGSNIYLIQGLHIYWDAVRDAGIRLKLSVMTQKPGILQVLPGTFDGTVHRMRVKVYYHRH